MAMSENETIGLIDAALIEYPAETDATEFEQSIAQVLTAIDEQCRPWAIVE